MTKPSEMGAARRRTDNLARLLAGEQGAEILAELQKLQLETAYWVDRPATTREVDDVIGAWRGVPTPDGPELRRRDLDPAEARTWADVEHVPAVGRNARVVLLGESSARGFLLDPVLNPALALQRRFDTAGDGVQVVDLTHGADIPDLLAVARRLPVLEPDVIVVYAGNNRVRSRHTPAHLDLLASALRADGYPGMRRCYLGRIVAPGVRRVLDGLTDVATATNARVVVVVPEFNLGGWLHDTELELPPLPLEELLAWTGHRERAEAALEKGDTAGVLAETAAMRALDEAMSPVIRRGAAAAAGERRPGVDLRRHAGVAARRARRPVPRSYAVPVRRAPGHVGVAGRAGRPGRRGRAQPGTAGPAGHRGTGSAGRRVLGRQPPAGTRVLPGLRARVPVRVSPQRRYGGDAVDDVPGAGEHPVGGIAGHGHGGRWHQRASCDAVPCDDLMDEHDARDSGAACSAMASTVWRSAGWVAREIPVIRTTGTSSPNQLHAYEVAEVSDGLVVLHNPWGRDHPDPMPVSDLLDNVQRRYAALRPEGGQHDGRW